MGRLAADAPGAAGALYHVAHLGGLTPGGLAFLTTGLALLPAVALALLILSIRQPEERAR